MMNFSIFFCCRIVFIASELIYNSTLNFLVESMGGLYMSVTS